MRHLEDYLGRLGRSVDLWSPGVSKQYSHYLQALSVVRHHVGSDSEMPSFVAGAAFLQFHRIDTWSPEQIDDGLKYYFKTESDESEGPRSVYASNIKAFSRALESLEPLVSSEGSFASQFNNLPIKNKNEISLLSNTRFALIAMTGVEEGFRIRLTQKEIDELYSHDGALAKFLNGMNASPREWAAMRIIITKLTGSFSSDYESQITCDFDNCQQMSFFRIQCPLHNSSEFLCLDHFNNIRHTFTAEMVKFTKTCRHTLDYRECLVYALDPTFNWYL